MHFRLPIVTFILVFTHSLSAEELHKAVRKGDIKKVRKLISLGTNINLRNKKGQTPLYFILSAPGNSHNKAMIELLIELGSDVNAKNTEDKTITIPPHKRSYENIERRYGWSHSFTCCCFRCSSKETSCFLQSKNFIQRRRNYFTFD